jgi:hypothetical protein
MTTAPAPERQALAGSPASRELSNSAERLGRQNREKKNLGVAAKRGLRARTAKGKPDRREQVPSAGGLRPDFDVVGAPRRETAR